MSQQVITLIGYRGSGKSCVAELLAQRLKCEWVDADVELERRESRSIAEIFKSDGEPHFRQLEQHLLQELLNRSGLVLAAGGGAVLSPNTRQQMKLAGPVIWLQASPQILAERIGGDEKSSTQRPSLTGQSIQQEIEDVLKARTPLYEETASFTIDTESNTPEEIVDKILDELASSPET